MSYSFEQICNFKEGEQYWESSQYGNLNFEVVEVNVFENGTKVEVLSKEVDTGEPIRHLVTKGSEHYGPSIYDYPAYIETKTLRDL